VLYPALAGDAKGVCVIHGKRAIVSHLAVRPRASPDKEGRCPGTLLSPVTNDICSSWVPLFFCDGVHWNVASSIAKVSLL
jgi:hypothetical protein